MTRRGRALAICVGVMLLGAGTVYALVSFDRVLSVAGEEWTDSFDESGEPFVVGFVGECRGAAWSATSDGGRLKLWAVTVGADVEGYIPVLEDDVQTVLTDAATGRHGDSNRFPDYVCSTRARERLAASAVLGLIAVGALYLGFRRRRPAVASEHSDA